MRRQHDVRIRAFLSLPLYHFLDFAGSGVLVEGISSWEGGFFLVYEEFRTHIRAFPIALFFGTFDTGSDGRSWRHSVRRSSQGLFLFVEIVPVDIVAENTSSRNRLSLRYG